MRSDGEEVERGRGGETAGGRAEAAAGVSNGTEENATERGNEKNVRCKEREREREKAISRENVLSFGRRAARSPPATKGIYGDGRAGVNSQLPQTYT